MNDLNSFVGVMFSICGVYLIYIALRAKFRGEVNDSILWGKDVSFSQCLDKEGFIAYTYPRFLISGLLILLDGICSFVGQSIPAVSLFDKYLVIVMLALFVWLVYFTRKASKIYFPNA